ncbi:MULTISPECIES: sugar phosphate isomerase/epimerase [Streptomyces]|uniref:Sugar phosphate isomerase/epimerase n=1 Tax=Streptomyces botrytidirepellens TaxID=2486417 RepID=A0A3M8W2C6_9ACTN|nr:MULTISPECIES: sugar phosphate isomerase/epimerase [Streptomyces]QLH20584.1 sugar phosphate isomerase/epimerase [Streptomyces sp. Rer75]RNG22153.1 sugar phosphate isomerase/epimerase [Streptomyces botrytidirepellens]
MRIIGHTLGTPEQTLPEALELFASAGLEGAEVIYQNDYRSGLPVGDDAAAAEAARVADDLGVPVVGLAPYTTGLNHEDPAQRRAALDELRATVDCAHRVGATRIRVYAGSWGADRTDHAGHWERLRASLSELAPLAADAGVRLCVENHFGTMTQSAKETARLIREVDSPAVRVLYDQANLTFTHDEAWPEALREQGDLIGHVHVKDLVFTDPDAPFVASETARVKADERAVRSRVVGDGIVPWSDILRAVKQHGYDDVLSLEYEYRWHPQDLPAPAEGFARAARVLRSLLDEAAGLTPAEVSR